MSVTSELDLKEKLKHMNCLNNTIDDSIISDFNWGRTKAEEQLYPHNKFYKTKITIIKKPNVYRKKIIIKDIIISILQNKTIFKKLFKKHNLNKKLQNIIIKRYIKTVYFKKTFYH